MNNGMMGKKLLIGCGLGAVALAVVLGSGATQDDGAPMPANSMPAMAAAEMPGVMVEPGMEGNSPERIRQVTSDQDYGDDRYQQRRGQQPMLQQVNAQQGMPNGAEVQRALQGLTQIRQQQCQSGNHLACQVLPQMPGYSQQLTQLEQGCRSGNQNACGAYQNLSQRIFTAYSESAAVMQQGAAAMAQMDAWRGQMNANAANSMANLQARGAAGQAAHQARQEANAAMNRSWEAGQASIDRGHGRYVDGIYNGTTMHGGGVQSRIPYGSTGYTDGNGNVIAVPNGSRAPDGWQAMDPTYAAPR